MSEPKIGLRAIVLACIVLCIAATLQGANAGQDKNGILKVASVDFEKVTGEYAAYNKSMKAWAEKAQASQTVFRTLQQHNLLSDADTVALKDLLTTELTQQGGLNPAQKEQKQKLIDKSKSLSLEFNQIQSKGGVLTAQDKEKLDTFTRLRIEGEARLQRLGAEYQEMLNSEEVKTKSGAMKSIRDAITKIGKEKGMSVIYASEIALYAENDLTENVLKELNK